MCTPASQTDSKPGCGGKCGPNCPGAIARAAAAKAASENGVPSTAVGGVEPAGGKSSDAHGAESGEESAGDGARPSPFKPPARVLPSLDVVTTFGATGSRVMLYPAHAPGPFYSARALVGFFLIALYLALPCIPVGGAPAIFLNVAELRFHLFGLTFLTQDLWLAFFVISGLGFALFTVTAILGRVWCGWACPLTVFLDVVRRMERWIEGDALKRKRLENEPWDFVTGVRRLLKHGVVGGLAVLVAHGFLAYFVSLPGLFKMMKEAPAAHPGAFLLVSGVTAVLWFCFAWFREQFCIVLCPYGRLQSVLTDTHTLVIGYDAQRGEPRGKARGNQAGGDCVDCLKCVQVCPTGIDIRQGLQLECIGCAACVDACDAVMAKLHRPRGLVRYDSLAGLAGQKRRFWRPRLALYGFLLLAGITAASISVSTLRSAVVSLTRLPGAPYFVKDNVLRNQFLLRVLNKQHEASHFTLAVEGEGPEGLLLQGDSQEEVQGWSEGQIVIVTTVPMQHWHKAGPMFLVVRDDAGRIIARKPFTLIGPEGRIQARSTSEQVVRWRACA